MNSLAKIVAINSFFTLSARLIVKLVSFAFTIFIARFLGEAEFGRYALIWSYVTIFATASDFGLGVYLIRELSRRPEGNRQHLTENVIIFRLVLAAFTMLLIALTTPLPGYSAETMAQIMLASSILLFYAVQDPIDSLLQAKERLDLSSAIRIAGQIAFVGLGAIFLLLGWGVTGLILAALSNVFISAVFGYWLVRNWEGGLRWQMQPHTWRRLLVTSLPFAIVGFAINWSQKIDTVILSLFWSEETIGWYNSAYNLVLGAIIISNSFNVALFPSVSRENSQNRQALVGIIPNVFKYLLTASLPMAVGMSLLSRQIIVLLYGAAYLPAVGPLAVLAWTIPLIFLSEFLRYGSFVLGREKLAAQAVLVAALSNLLLNLIFIPRYGMTAAATTTVITEAVLVILYSVQARSVIAPTALISAAWRPAMAAVVMVLSLLFTEQTHFLISLAVAMVSYGGSLLLLGFWGAEEKMFMRKLKDHFLPSRV